ncbi:TonB-dependent receptor [Ravibacter arvi]|uniref:TonB-dependent receptor n=1 Tax=Ravibacter arvi TaxID=2051041 RepID=A0ABP8LUI1_9BACT
MNKKLHVPLWIWNMMKISTAQLLLFALFCGVAFANESNGQAVLEKRVTVHAVGVPFKKVLSLIEAQANVRFIYSPNAIDVRRKVRVYAENEKLEVVLKTLLNPYSIEFAVSDDRMIALKPVIPAGFRKTMSVGGAEEITGIAVTGKVTDEKGEGMPGVSILLKGTQQGLITGVDGDFSIEVPDGNAVLVFSFVGYLSQEITVGNQSTINVRLAVDEKSLDEVIVVGYGEQSKKKLSTSISKVSAKDIGNLPVALPGDALAGLAAGVQVQAGAGDVPGTAPTIRIRGIGSLGASNQPLYVIDGYPLNATEFSRLNLSDIESIEILKDAASAAIYGSRAANGVVLVTTKRGQEGKTTFNINAYTGIQQAAKRIEMMNKEEYLQYVKDARGATNQPYPDAYNNPGQLPDTDWQDVILRTAPMSKIELSARGGSEKVRFSLSGSYLNQKGTMIGTDYELVTLRGNIDANISRNLTLGAGFAPSFTTRDNMPTPRAPANWSYSPIYAAMLMPPVVDVRLPNGDYGQNNVLPHTQYGFSEIGVHNPLAVVELYQNRDRRFAMQNNLFLEWEFLKGVKFKTQGGASWSSNGNEMYVPSTIASPASPLANLSNPLLTGIAASASNGRGLDWIWENSLAYSGRIGTAHNLSAMLLYSMQKYTGFTTSSTGRVGTFTNDLVRNPTASSNQAGSVSYDANAFLSYAARITYDYKDKYLFSGSVRTDGSSRFGPNNRFGVFQSYSLGWRVSEESFMKDQHIFDELKIRASYGETGNANIGDFTWISGLTPTHYAFGGQRFAGVSPSGFMNRDLTWEKSKQVNLGLDAAFLKNRIQLTVDLYQKNTHGMLFSKELPGIVGYATSFQTNIGEIRNRGIEIDLNTENTTGMLKWSTGLNVSYNATEVLDLGGRSSLNTFEGTPGWPNVYKIEVGQPLGNFYGFKIDGVIKNEQQLTSNAQWPGSGVGDYQIRDVNGDGVINEGDRTLLGNGFPRLLFGLTNNLRYGNFDLSIIAQGVAKNSIINGASRHTELWAGRFNTVKEMVNNYFDPANPDRDVKYARVGLTRAGFGTAGNLHSYAVYSGAFLRLRNVTLGYTLPAGLQEKWGINATRIYVTGQNLLTFTKYPGLNPEPSQYGETVYQPGSDQGTYPVNRSFMIGVNISF